MASAAVTPFLFTPVESGLGGLTLGLLAYTKLSVTGRWVRVHVHSRGACQHASATHPAGP